MIETFSMLPSMIKVISAAIALYGAFIIISARNEYGWLMRGLLARQLVDRLGIRGFKIVYMVYGFGMVVFGAVIYFIVVPIIMDRLQGSPGLNIFPNVHPW